MTKSTKLRFHREFALSVSCCCHILTSAGKLERLNVESSTGVLIISNEKGTVCKEVLNKF